MPARFLSPRSPGFSRFFPNLPLSRQSQIREESFGFSSNTASAYNNSGSFLRWFSGIVAASGFGMLCWSSTSSFSSCSFSSSSSSSNFLQNSLVSFLNWHAEASECSSEHNLADGSHTSNDVPKYFLGDTFRRKIFFNYEKRIRMRSPPEKVFQYFASSRSLDREVLMTPADFMRAVVPVFPPSESNFVRYGFLRGERNPGELCCDPSDFFALFDVNGDGFISFKEYIFFVTLLSIPESCFSIAFKMFDLDNDGEIDEKEFKRVMTLMRAHNRQGSVHRNGLRLGLKVGGAVEDGGLMKYFFGKDGSEQLNHDKFVEFLSALHDEILRLEFIHYDYKKRGSISAKDFALSMVASADITHVSKLLARVNELDNHPQLREIRIDFNEFKKFSDLRKKLLPLSIALFSYGEVNGLLMRTDFKRAAEHVCGVPISDDVVELVFHVFDSNNDGSLCFEEFVRVLEKRERGIAQPTEAGPFSFLSCCWTCAKSCSISRLLF